MRVVGRGCLSKDGLEMKQKIIDYAVYLLVRFIICAIQAIHIRTCAAFARQMRWLGYDVLKIRRDTIDENLSFAFPEKSLSERQNIARDMWEHLILMICEIAQAPRKVHETNWRQFFSITNKREIVSYLLDRRPVVLVSGHYGNFEIAGFMLGLLGVPTFTIARTLDNPYLNTFLNRFREAKGQFIVAKQGSAGQLDDVLAQGGKLVLLGDQHAGPKGCWVDFLGRPASCHKAIAVFPMSAAAPLAVVYGRRTHSPMHFEMGMQDVLDPADPQAQLGGVKPITQWYNQQLEILIRAFPGQYWWLHRRWRDAPAKLSKSATLQRTAA
jgi:KDO2-lipid IV(A) lauroyltransferase